MYDNIFYFNHINIIGGIETFFYEMAIKYSDTHDITIVYKTGNQAQIDRLEKYVRVIQHQGQTIHCKRAYFNYNIDIIDNVIAEEYIQILHGDYKSLGIKPNTHEKITRYIAISEIVKNSFEELTNKKSELIYNPYTQKETKRVLMLVSATRLTADKGKHRMIKLGEELNKAGIPYIWFIFTDDNKAIKNPNIVYVEPRLDVLNYIKKADYLVQLSNAEGYCYSIVEALSIGTPVIATKMKVLEEIGVNKDNSILLDFDMNNLDIEEIYNKEFNFSYKPPKSNWDRVLIKGELKYKKEQKMKFKVIANGEFKRLRITDKILGRIPEENEEWVIEGKQRLNILLGENAYSVNFLKDYKEIKEKKKEEKKETKKIEDSK